MILRLGFDVGTSQAQPAALQKVNLICKLSALSKYKKQQM